MLAELKSDPEIALIDPALVRIPLSQLATLCRIEVSNFRGRATAAEGYGDYSACYELFRRMAEAPHGSAARDEAFVVILELFGHLIPYWLRRTLRASSRHAGDGTDFAPVQLSPEDYADLEAEARAKIARSPLFQPGFTTRFVHLRRALGYMQVTVKTVAFEYMRSRRSYSHTTAYDPEILQRLNDTQQQRDNTGHHGYDDVAFEELWRAIAECLNHDERKVTFMRARFVYGLPPREILKRYGHLYKSTGELDELRQKVLDQLRKNDMVRSFLIAA